MPIYTDKARFTGMSGVDVESMVTSIMKAESVKYEKLNSHRKLLEWEQKAYQDVNTSLKTFQQTHLDLLTAKTNMRNSSIYNGFEISSKINGEETNTVNITTTDKTKEGIYKIKIGEIATKDRFSGSPLMANSLVSGGINSGDFTEGDSFTITLDNGNAKKIIIEADEVAIFNSGDATQIANILNKKLINIYGESMTEPGSPRNLKAIVKNGNLTIAPLEGHSIKLDIDNSNQSVNGTRRLETFSSSDFVNLSGGFTLNNVNVTVDTNVSNSAELAQNINIGLKDAGFENIVSASVEIGQDGSQTIKINLLDKSVAKFSTVGGGLLSDLGLQDEASTPGNFKISNVLEELGFENRETNKLNPNVTLGEMFGIVGQGNFIVNNKTIAYDHSETVSKFMERVNSSGANVTLSFDSTNNLFLLESNNFGYENKIVFGDPIENNLSSKLGLTTYEEGKDAKFSIDNKEFTRSTNNFELYGLNFKLNSITVMDEEIEVSTGQDVTKSLDSIKTFINDYNKLLEELYSKYNTRRTKKGQYDYFEPLVAEQKAGMSESEIENWENEAKKGLLYRDKILEDMLKTMRTMIYEPVALEDGRKISLNNIGISTSNNYRDGGKLIIDESKLKKSLMEKPIDCAVLFTKSATINPTLNEKNLNARISEEGISERINDVINTNISLGFGKLTLKAGTLETVSVNEMTKEIFNVDEKLTFMEKQLIKKEEMYYEKFSRMEAAINEANAQMSSILSLNTGRQEGA